MRLLTESSSRSMISVVTPPGGLCDQAVAVRSLPCACLLPACPRSMPSSSPSGQVQISSTVGFFLSSLSSPLLSPPLLSLPPLLSSPLLPPPSSPSSPPPSPLLSSPSSSLLSSPPLLSSPLSLSLLSSPLLSSSSPLSLSLSSSSLLSSCPAAPLGPMSARRSPGRTASSTPSTARSPPNDLQTASSWSASGSLDVTLLAVLAGRIVARVERPLEIVLGLVGPELADAGDRGDHRVLQAAAHALDLAHVDVLDGVAVGVDRDRSARACP